MSRIISYPIVDIKKHAIDAYPEESCGFIMDDDTYVRCENQHSNPTESFLIDPIEFLEHADRVKVLVHSHPDGNPYPSKQDMVGQLDTAVIWGICCTDGKNCLEPFFWGADTPIEPLIGRTFRHGITDCYSLIRDWYLEHGIELPYGPRNWKWWDEGESLYLHGLSKAGFKRIEIDNRRHPKYGDLVFMHFLSETANHAGIYLGNGLILHHLGETGYDPSSLSTREPIGRFNDSIIFWARHEKSISPR